MLAFHGTRRVNLDNILSGGGLKLRNTAVKTGDMFGHGLYAGLNSSKSFNYTFGSNVLLAVAVDAQKPLELASATPDAPARCADGGYDGVHARGQTTVAEWAPMPDKMLRVPASFGAGPDDSTLLYDELVVYEEARMSLAYVLVVEKLGDEPPITTPPEPPKLASSNVSIRELKVDAARYGIDAQGMEKAELAAAVDAARAASEARRRTGERAARGGPACARARACSVGCPSTRAARRNALRLRYTSPGISPGAHTRSSDTSPQHTRIGRALWGWRGGRAGGAARHARASQRIFRSSGLGCLWSFEAATGESAADVKYESPAVRDSVASWWDM